MHHRLILACSLFFLLGLSSCVVQKSEITSAYQKALECYYGALGEEGNTNPCLSKLNRLIANNRQDLEAISLRSQIYWYRFLKDSSSVDRDRFLRDLQFLEETITYSPDAKDWVAPRVYVSFGDFLVWSAEKVKQGKPQFYSIERSLALYEASAHAYRHALDLALEQESLGEPTKGLRREKVNARAGLMESLGGKFAALSRLQIRIEFGDPPFETTGGENRIHLVEMEKQQVLGQMEALRLGDDVQDYRDFSLLRLNPSRQESLADIQLIVLDDFLLNEPVLGDSCRTALDADRPVSETCLTVLRAAEKAVIHASIALEMRNRPGDFQEKLTQALQNYSKALAECAFCE